MHWEVQASRCRMSGIKGVALQPADCEVEICETK